MRIFRRWRRALVTAFGLLCIVTSAAAADRVGDWAVALPADALKTLGMSERTCASRATGLMNGGNFRAAANEWKRFNAEFLTTASEGALAWASFLQAYAFDRANDKFRANELYNETIELYPDQPAAAAALFFRGQSHGQNGKTAKECADYTEIVNNPALAAHPLAFTARARLAQAALGRGKLDEAVAFWEASKALPRDAARAEWDAAAGNLDALAMLADPNGRLAASLDKGDAKPAARRGRLLGCRQALWNASASRPAGVWFAQNRRGAKDGAAATYAWRQAMTEEFLRLARPLYAELGDTWGLLNLEYEIACAFGKKDAEATLQKIGEAIRQTPDAKTRNDHALHYIGLLKRLGRTRDAKLFLDLVADAGTRAWTAVGIGWQDRDAKYIVENLQKLEESDDPGTSGRAKRDHARCCQDLTHEYDEAIRLYEEAPEPPGTLWRVANCHRAAGRKKNAQATLDEICGVFPGEAPNAMLTKGDWYAADGDKKNAIGCYRRILAHAEWKKAGAASQAHQRLEKYGIATGGAVLNDVH